MAEGLETHSSWKNLDFGFMKCEEERGERNTHLHKETKTEKGTVQGKVSNEIKASDLEQSSCNWKNFDRRRVRESAISAKKKSSSARKLEPHQQKTNFARMEWSRVHKQTCNCQCRRRRRAASWSFCSNQLTDN
jgi:hypothetical protein